MKTPNAPEKGAHPLVRHSRTVHSLDPDDPGFDDLAAFQEFAGDAQVVGIGEGAHFVREHALARARLVRSLVECGGFTHVALELGRCQAARLQPWLAGEVGEDDLARRAGPLTIGLYGSFLRWLRRYNTKGPQSVVLLGPDLPNTLSPISDLEVVARFFEAVDSDALSIIDEARRIAVPCV